MGQNTGMKVVLTLRKYVDGQATDETKINASNDPDYIAPYIDTASCPINAPTPTTTTTTTVAPGTTTTTTTQAQCYTYIVENRNQSGGPNINYSYVDCDGNVQSDVVPAGSETLDFCAKPGTVVLAGNGGGYTEVAQTCLQDPLPTTTTTTTVAPTTTTTTSPGCATYVVTNQSQFDDAQYTYKSCDGSQQGTFTVFPDRDSEPFCAQVGSVVIFGYNGSVEKTDDNCTV